MLGFDDDDFGECGMGGCDNCAALGSLPQCPSKSGGSKKYKTAKVKVYRIVKVKGKIVRKGKKKVRSKGLVMIVPAGTIKCRTRKLVKKVKPGVGLF